MPSAAHRMRSTARLSDAPLTVDWWLWPPLILVADVNCGACISVISGYDRMVSSVPHTINNIRCLPIWSMPNGWSSDNRKIVAMAITPNSLTNRFILYYFWWCKVTSFPAYNYQHVFTFYPKMVAIYPSPWYLSQKNRRLSPAIARFPEHLYLCTRIAKQIRI